MSANANTNSASMNDVPHSKPIDIDSARGRQPRRRAESVSSSDSPPPMTPSSPSRPAISPSTSPILSYFLSQQQSPTKTGFPFSRPFASNPVEDEEADFGDAPPTSAHKRRVSSGFNSVVFTPPTTTARLPESQQERGKNLLRRLSLGGAMQRPNMQRTMSPPPRIGTPPQSAGVAMQNPNTPRRAQRSATVGAAQGAKIPRSPSPMGERILKGHFDGFN